MYVCTYVRQFQNVVLYCPTPRLHCFLSSHWPSFRFISFMAFLIPSIQFFFSLPRAVFCFSIHFSAVFRNLPRQITRHFILYTIKIVYCQGDMLWPLLGHLEALWENSCLSYVYWTVHHLDSWIERDQLMSLALFFAQPVSNASTFIFRSLRLCVGILLWFDVHIEPEQYTHTRSQAPEDECTSIRNMLSKK